MKKKEVVVVRPRNTRSLCVFERGIEDESGCRVDHFEFENEETNETWDEEKFFLKGEHFGTITTEFPILLN